MTRLEELRLEHVKLQKDYAKFLLNKLSLLDPDVMVAGGAPRDWDDNKPAKDLDIYIQGIKGESTWSLAYRVNRILIELDIQMRRNEDPNYVDYTNKNGVAAVYNLSNVAVPTQLIICDMYQHEMINLFDCSLSMLWMSDSGFIHKKPEYTVSRKYKTYFLKTTADNEYKERIRSKFPDYKEVLV